MTKQKPGKGAVSKKELRRSGQARGSPQPDPAGNRAERRAAASVARKADKRPENEQKKEEEKKDEEKKDKEKKDKEK